MKPGSEAVKLGNQQAQRTAQVNARILDLGGEANVPRRSRAVSQGGDCGSGRGREGEGGGGNEEAKG